MDKTIFGIFDNRADAQGAINSLREEGFDPKDISIVMHDNDEAEAIEEDTGTDIVGGTATGAVTGAVLGGITGFLAGTVLPGLAGFFIAGPIGAALGLTGAAATTVSGAAAGALTGGLVGALTSFGLSEDDARYYETRVREGAILIAVAASENDDSSVKNIFDEYNASDVKMVSHDAEKIIERGERRSMSEDTDIHPRSRFGFGDEDQHQFIGAKGGSARRRRE